MFLKHVGGLFVHPREEWETIRTDSPTIFEMYYGHVAVLSLIPAICGYIGAAMIGWETPSGEVKFVTPEAAMVLAAVSYFALWIDVFIIGYFIHWMANTYGTEVTLRQGVKLAAYTATPMFFGGLMGLFPSLWVFMIAGPMFVGYSIYLLYLGVPIVMQISQERGFLFSSSVMTIGLVFLVAKLAVTAIFWGMGFMPEYQI